MQLTALLDFFYTDNAQKFLNTKIQKQGLVYLEYLFYSQRKQLKTGIQQPKKFHKTYVIGHATTVQVCDSLQVPNKPFCLHEKQNFNNNKISPKLIV